MRYIQFTPVLVEYLALADQGSTAPWLTENYLRLLEK